MQTVFDIIKAFPGQTLLAGLIVVVVGLLLVPIILRLAGLTGQQIVDTLTLTMQFAINIIREFRAQNKNQ